MTLSDVFYFAVKGRLGFLIADGRGEDPTVLPTVLRCIFESEFAILWTLTGALTWPQIPG
jgi:hypothetical protein